jgi:hypothetical protein
VLIFATSACFAGGPTVDDYLKLKASLKVSTISLGEVKKNLSGKVGNVIELSGTVSGTIKSGNASSFVLSCSGESLIISADQAPECVSNGSTIRALIELGPKSVVCLSDLKLRGAAYEWEVAKREKDLASKSVKPQPAPDRSRPELTSRGGTKPSERVMAVYEPYRNAIAQLNPRLSKSQLEEITLSILVYSDYYKIDPRLVIALIIAESNFNINAKSPKGAMGLGQLMPGTARGLGVRNAYDPEQNIAGCIKLMSGHLSNYGHLSLALSAYNAGPGAVKKYGGVPPYRETQNYVAKVTAIYKALCGK